MNTRKTYKQPDIQPYLLSTAPLLGINTHNNVEINDISEGDASTAQSKAFTTWEDEWNEKAMEWE